MVGLLARLVNAEHRLCLPCGTRAPVWALVLALCALILNFVPLFNLLGYDFAFAIGIVTSFAAADMGHGAVTRARVSPGRPTPSVFTLMARAVACAWASLALPLALSALNGLRVRNCSFSTGLAFYALLPVATAAFAAPAGVLVALLFPRRGRGVALALPALSFAWAGLRMYISPPVYALDPFAGYFPGPIYDEALTPPARLWQFRLANLLWIVAAAAVAAVCVQRDGAEAPQLSLRGSRLRACWQSLRWEQLSALALLTSAALLVFVQGNKLGFRRSHNDLREHLSRTNVTAHFEVHSSPADGQSPHELKLFLDELEFRYQQLSKLLNVEPALPIKVFLFPNADAKKDLVGAGATLFTKPWRQEIYLQVEAFPPENLRHELAHIFASAFGDPIFGISLRWFPFPRLASGLVEGVAEATDYDNPSGQATLHQDARSIVEQGRNPGLRSLVGAGFSTVAGPSAYTLAASFCQHLLAQYGPEKLKRVYRGGGNFEAVYGQSLDALEQQWLSFIKQQPVDESQRQVAKERFRRPAIFKKVCARELAARVAEAADLRHHQPERAVDLLQSVCADDPLEPTYALSLAYAQAAARDTQAARKTLNDLLQHPELTVPLERRVVSFRAALEVAAGNIPAAIAAETRSLTLATEESDHRTALARLRALRTPSAQATLGRVLFGDSPTESLDAGLVVFLLAQFAQDHPDEALGPYLLGRQLVARDPVLALAQLDKACPDEARAALPIALEPVFQRECWRLRGESAYRAGKFDLAAQAWMQAEALAARLADRLRARDALARITWAKAAASN